MGQLCQPQRLSQFKLLLDMQASYVLWFETSLLQFEVIRRIRSSNEYKQTRIKMIRLILFVWNVLFHIFNTNQH